MLQVDPVDCRECGMRTCHIPDEADETLKQYDGLCPKCAMLDAARKGDDTMIKALVDVTSASIKLAIEITQVDEDECTPEHVYAHIMEFLGRYPDLRKRLKYELDNSEVVVTPVTRNDPRFG